MAAGNAQTEPTMEEILASIRRIISEEGDEAAPVQAAEPEAVSVVEEPEMVEPEEDFAKVADVIETEDDIEAELESEPEFEEAEPEFETAQGDEIIELTEVIDDTPMVEPVKPNPILSKQTADLAAQPFSQLSGLLVRNYPGSENTLEGLVSEMIRPMLKQWLDENLPTVVERMVAKEIARLTNRD